MADVEVSYKNAVIKSASDSGTITLKTKQKYCEDDILINYIKPGAGTKVVASGTITGSNSHSFEINVGEEMASQNFLIDIYAVDNSEFPYNTNYNMISFFYLHSDEFGSFAFSATESGYDKYDFTAKKYNVNNEGTITEVNVKPGASFDSVRQTTVNQGGYGTPLIRKYSDHFSVFWQRGNAQYVFPNTITYNFRVIYFGNNWASDKLTL